MTDADTILELSRRLNEAEVRIKRIQDLAADFAAEFSNAKAIDEMTLDLKNCGERFFDALEGDH